MRNIDNKLYADYMSDHVIMTFPWMYKKQAYYNDLANIYIKLSNIFIQNNIQQTLIIPNEKNYDEHLTKLMKNNTNIINYDCDDIWIRDYYPKLYFNHKNKRMINYEYNGYGKKYTYSKDNSLKEIINNNLIGINLKEIILEGGNLEFSSKGVLLTNRKCLVSNNINLTENEITNRINILKDKINISEVFMIDINPIEGDDTNGHIDNLVRFIDDETIVYFASDDKKYPNYNIACQLKEQIEDILKRSKIIKKLIPIYHSSKDILKKNNRVCPYSKLNFVVTKNCFVFPSIDNNKDDINIQLKSLNLNKKVYVVNSETSLIENGGLHCLTTNV